MTFRKTVCALAFLLSLALTAAATESGCKLRLAELKQPPEMYGLRLGLTVEQVKALVPTLQPGRTDELGFATTSFSPDFNPQMNKAAYAGVRTVSLEFLDGRLFTLWIGYNSSFKWKTLEEFVPGMTGALGLPTGAWSPEDAPKPRLLCAEFEVTAQMIGQGPSIRLVDRAARELWEQRRAELEEKRSAESPDEP